MQPMLYSGEGSSARPGAVLRLVVALCATLAWGAACAQHRVVGPDGRITYTDRPQNYEQADGRSSSTPEQARTGSMALAGLPYALRQAVQRWPVRLYASGRCDPCDQGREWLRRQGVPVQEWQIQREEDVQALQRETGSQELPVLMVGAQRLLGFDATDWTQMLRLAGYPLGQPLPQGWTPPPPQPLVPVTRPTRQPPEAAPQPPGPPSLTDLGDPERFRF